MTFHITSIHKGERLWNHLWRLQLDNKDWEDELPDIPEGSDDEGVANELDYNNGDLDTDNSNNLDMGSFEMLALFEQEVVENHSDMAQGLAALVFFPDKVDISLDSLEGGEENHPVHVDAEEPMDNILPIDPPADCICLLKLKLSQALERCQYHQQLYP